MDEPVIDCRTARLKCTPDIAAGDNKGADVDEDSKTAPAVSAPAKSVPSAIDEESGEIHDAMHGLLAAKRCNMRWDTMLGDDRARLCSACNLHVFRSPQGALEELRRQSRSNSLECLSERIFRRFDGTYTVGDCYTKRNPVALLIANWVHVMFRPEDFFARLPSENAPIGAGKFYLTLSAIDVFLFWSVVFSAFGLCKTWLWQLSVSLYQPMPQVSPPLAVAYLLGITVGGSLIWTFTNWVGSVIIFLLARATGGKGSFRQTYRVCAYSSAPIAFRWIPICGIFATTYSLNLLYRGLKSAHELSKRQSLVLTGLVGIGMLALMLLLTLLLLISMYRCMEPG